MHELGVITKNSELLVRSVLMKQVSVTGKLDLRLDKIHLVAVFTGYLFLLIIIIICVPLFGALLVLYHGACLRYSGFLCFASVKFNECQSNRSTHLW